MKTDNILLLDAALSVFMRYGFKRTTIGKIAKAANLSRPTLYARYANKDDVYAAVFALYVERTLSTLQGAWADCDTLSEKLECLWDASVLPSFQILTQNPDASDMIEGVESPAGQLAMSDATQKVVAVLATAFTPFESALKKRGQTPEQVAIFIDQSKHMMLRTAKTENELRQHFSTLKAATMALTS